MRKRRTANLILAALLLAAAFTMAFLPVHGEEAIYDSVIRLHVLANSDSKEDQALKLTVRDAVLEKTGGLLAGVSDREEAALILSDALPLLQQTAEQTLTAAGAPAPVRVTLSEEDYPTRQYETLAFPAGEYLSLRVMIGEAAGQNWWCVLFPPLCLSAASSKSEAETAFLSAGLTDEQYRIITDSGNAKYKLRFKILEVAEDLFGDP